LRRRHHVVEVLAAWEPDQDGAPHRAWADHVATSLAAGALPGGYANLLGPDDHDQITHAYGPNAGRLRELKKRFDPQGMFTAIPLPARAPAGGLICPDSVELVSQLDDVDLYRPILEMYVSVIKLH
jgi:Berberine and berberine like